MPTATRISQYRLSNWGPLTTTFTADAACATAGNTVVTFRNTAGVGLNPECAVHTVGPCYPSGPELDAYASSVYNDVDQFIIGYFSPGFVCPSGWKTVGVAAKASDGSVSTSGIFEATTPLASTTSRIRPLFNPPINAFTAGIDPGETGVVCCPSSMIAVMEGHCVSTLADYKASTACQRFLGSRDISVMTAWVTFFGQGTSTELVTLATSGSIASTATTSFSGSQASELVGVSVMPMVTLVYRAQDTAAAGKQKEEEEGTAMGEICQRKSPKFW